MNFPIKLLRILAEIWYFWVNSWSQKFTDLNPLPIRRSRRLDSFWQKNWNLLRTMSFTFRFDGKTDENSGKYIITDLWFEPICNDGIGCLKFPESRWVSFWRKILTLVVWRKISMAELLFTSQTQTHATSQSDFRQNFENEKGTNLLTDKQTDKMKKEQICWQTNRQTCAFII